MALTQDQLDALRPFLDNVRLASERIRTWSDIENSQRRTYRDAHDEFISWYKKHIKYETEERQKSLDMLEKANNQFKRNREIERDSNEKMAVLRKARERLEAEQVRLAALGQTLSQDQADELRNTVDEYTKQRKRFKEAFLANREIKQQMELTRDTLRVVTWKDYASGLKQHAQSVLKSKVSLVAFTNAIKAVYTEIQGMVTASGGFIEGANVFSSYLSNVVDGLSMAMSPKDLAEIMTANRQAMLAFGGQSKMMKVFTDDVGNQASLIKQYTVYTGDQVAAAKALTGQMTMFYRAGVSPSQNALIDFAKDIGDLSMRTGVSVTDLTAKFTEMYNNDADMQIKLRAASKEQREEILRNTTALIKQSVAVGMSAEQAFEASKMLNKMTSAKPLERIKTAARIRALGGAMGIAGTEEAARAVQSGSQTKEALEAVKRFGTQAANIAAESRLSGNMGQEIFVSSLLEKLDLEKYFGDGSPFVTRLAEVMAPQTAALNSLLDVAKTAWAETSFFLKQISTIISGPLGNLIGVAVGAVLLKALAGGALGSAGTAVAGAATAIAGTTAAIAGAAAGVIGAGQAITDVMQGGRGDNFINDAFESLFGLKDQSLGSRIYDWMNPEEQQKSTGAAAADKEEKAAKEEKAREQQAAQVDKQTDKLGDVNTYLRMLNDTAQRQLEVAEKQLAATIVSSEDRATAFKELARGNRFMSTYGTIG